MRATLASGRPEERVTASSAGKRLRVGSILRAPWSLAGVAQSTITSAVLLLGLLLVYGGVSRDFGAAEKGLREGSLLDLNAADAPARIEAFLERVDPGGVAEPAELTSLLAQDAGRVPNVGSLAARGAVSGETLARLKPHLVVRHPDAFRRLFWFWALLCLAVFPLVHVLLAATARQGNPLFLLGAQALSGLGLLAMAGLRDPLRDVMLFVGSAQGILLGLVAFVAAALPRWEHPVLRRLALVPLAAALALSAALVLFGTGPAGSDAKVNLWGVQPIEAIRMLTVFFLAGWFGTRWESLRELHERPIERLPLLSSIRVPRREHLVPLLVGVGAGLGFFFVQRDLGPALLLLASFLALYAVARRHLAGALAGIAAIVVAFALAAAAGIPRTVALRVAMWLDPWENGLARGDQLAHALWAFAAGGFGGTGLALGSPELIPAGHTDLVLAAIAEELGFAGILAVGVLLAVVVAAGLEAARHAPGDYTRFLALGLTLGLAFEALLIFAGILGLLPLSGVVAPFVSYGRSAMVMHLATLGVLWSISASRLRPAVPAPSAPRTTVRLAARGTDGPFTGPLRVLALVLAAFGTILLGRALWIQGVRADTLLARPVLVRQADGAHRYQDDPRLRAVAAELVPRGDIVDRNGLPLATSDPAKLEARRAAFEELGIVVEQVVPEAGAPRSYPLAGLASHVLGDLNTRADWGASNTSFLERDEDDILRGWDDRAQLVTRRDAQGTVHRLVRRDLSDLVPLWRHQNRRGHAAVRAIVERDRTLYTSLDARLQVRLAQELRERLAAAGLAAGAVVVLDPDTGELLASVSYPWPSAARSASAARGAAEREEQARLDRARFGLYPPGSTFKIVTAAAALGVEPALAHERFPCRPLPGGRVGTVLDGRPVRDDPSDHVAHGLVDMERATVVSCNAYYAQLGLRVGWDDLEATAASWGIDLAAPEGGTERAEVRDAAYGQGRVVATPIEMARVAGTLANHGRLAPLHIARAGAADANVAEVVLEADAADRIAGYLRQVVVAGTGKRLAAEPIEIAGKTGTAQVAGGAPHAWFIGWAPYGSPGRRVAFAVLLEHGGYGGAAAAEVARRIVRESKALGLIGTEVEP